MNVSEWFEQRTYACESFAWLKGSRTARLATDPTVTLVLPTRNVSHTIGSILSRIIRFNHESRLIDQIVVVDAASTDGTADIARTYDVEVYLENELMPHYGETKGKGDALWRSLSVAKGDIVMFADSDTTNFDTSFIYGVLGPILTIPEVHFVKAAYRRPFAAGMLLLDDSGGRVTELMAKPLISLLYPDLAGFVQPLAGEFAAYRELLSSIPFLTGYGVDVGILIDIFRRLDLYSMAQVDLGVRQNQHQALTELSRMSYTIMCAVTHRANLHNRINLSGDATARAPNHATSYLHARATEAGLRLDFLQEDLVERPPMIHAQMLGESADWQAN